MQLSVGHAIILAGKTNREEFEAVSYTHLDVYKRQRQGSRRFVSPMGRLELADYLCVDRSALTRELGRMQEEGLVSVDKNVFEVKRAEG